MKNPLFLLVALVSVLTGCGDDVPKVENPHKVVVNGQPMSQKDFLTKYCLGKSNHETCLKVSQAMSLDSGKGGLPKGW